MLAWFCWPWHTPTPPIYSRRRDGTTFSPKANTDQAFFPGQVTIFWVISSGDAPAPTVMHRMPKYALLRTHLYLSSWTLMGVHIVVASFQVEKVTLTAGTLSVSPDVSLLLFFHALSLNIHSKLAFVPILDHSFFRIFSHTSQSAFLPSLLAYPFSEKHCCFH